MKKTIAILCLSLVAITCKDIQNVEDISEDQVRLVAPIDDALLALENVNFSWDQVDFAEGYRLQVMTPNFETPLQLVLDTIVANTNFTHSLDPETYQWRVRAENSAFATPYSAARDLIVDEIPFPDKEVRLIRPTDNTNSNDLDQNLEWESVLGATEYTIQILGMNGQVLLEETIAETSLAATFIEGSFTWQVQAIRNLEITDFSTNTIIIDTTAPNQPSPVAPADQSASTETAISFSWSRTDLAGSAEKDSIYIYTDSSLQTLLSKNQGTNKSFSSNLQTGTFYWNVKAFDEAGNTSDLSDIFSFTIN